MVVWTPVATPPEFRTHANYVKFLRGLAENLTCKCTINIKKSIKKHKDLEKKVTLAKLTLESIEGEYNRIQKSKEYAQVCAPWISVKAYYLLFYLLVILDYLITSSEFSLWITHGVIHKNIKSYIEKGELFFNKKVFNINFKCSDIMQFKVTPGSHLITSGFNRMERLKSVLKKLHFYKLDDLKRDEKLSNFRSKKARTLRDNFLKANSINLLEFFYLYRVKANYRDLEFLKHNINDEEFAEYYSDHYYLSLSIYKCFRQTINDLANLRFGKSII